MLMPVRTGQEGEGRAEGSASPRLPSAILPSAILPSAIRPSAILPSAIRPRPGASWRRSLTATPLVPCPVPARAQMLSMSSGMRDPMRQVELWGFTFSILLGACLSALFIAALTTAISEADASAKDYRTKLDMVRQYMRHSQLPRPLRSKLMEYFELRYPSKRAPTRPRAK